jgi:hypothetical protein
MMATTVKTGQRFMISNVMDRKLTPPAIVLVTAPDYHPSESGA